MIVLPRMSALSRVSTGADSFIMQMLEIPEVGNTVQALYSPILPRFPFPRSSLSNPTRPVHPSRPARRGGSGRNVCRPTSKSLGDCISPSVGAARRTEPVRTELPFFPYFFPDALVENNRHGRNQVRISIFLCEDVFQK